MGSRSQSPEWPTRICSTLWRRREAFACWQSLLWWSCLLSSTLVSPRQQRARSKGGTARIATVYAAALSSPSRAKALAQVAKDRFISIVQARAAESAGDIGLLLAIVANGGLSLASDSCPKPIDVRTAPHAEPLLSWASEATQAGSCIHRIAEPSPDLPRLDANSLLDARLLVRALGAGSGSAISEYARLISGSAQAAASAPIPVLTLTIQLCGTHCDPGPTRSIVVRRLQFIVASRGSAATVSESTGLSQFLRNSLLARLNYPASSALHDVAVWSSVDFSASAANSTEASNILVARLADPSLTREKIPAQFLDTAASHAGSVGAVAVRFTTCAITDSQWSAAVETINRASSQTRLTPFLRIGIALDLTAAQRCGITVPHLARAQLLEHINAELLRTDASAKIAPGVVYEAWSAITASCLVGVADDHSRSAARTLATRYLAEIDGPGFSSNFRVQDTYAALVLSDPQDACPAGDVWWKSGG